MNWDAFITDGTTIIDQWLNNRSPAGLLLIGALGVIGIWLTGRWIFPKNHRQTGKQNVSETEATLAGIAERIGRIDAAQANLAALSSQIIGLERTLSDKQARGAFGEARLGDLLRDALPPHAFKEQATLANGRRADALLLIPYPPGPIVIDSKFPLESYRTLIAANDPKSEKSARKSFERDVSKHIADIADRYSVPGETADCALMFVPSEAVFAELHARSSSAVDEGYSRRVFIVSPTTIWALLNTIRAIMKDAQMTESSVTLQAEAQALVADVTAIAQAAETARRRIELAGSDLTNLVRAAKTAERRGRRIHDLDFD